MTTASAPGPAVVVDSVTKTFGSTDVVSELSFDVRPH